MFKLYRDSQTAQFNWIREHPVQYVALNAVLIVAFIGYLEYQDRKEMREINKIVAEKTA